MSLELDPRCDLPIPQPLEKEFYQYHNEQPLNNNNSVSPSHTPAQQHGLKNYTKFFFSIALGVITVLAIVAAAVGGSIAVKRSHE